MTGVKVSFSGLDAYDVAPQKLPDLMARRPLVLFGKYRGRPQGRIEVNGMSGNGHVRHSLDVRPADVRADNGALPWLWARRWVETLDDERAMGAGKAAEDAITAIGLDYRLLTAFTSFVAIDSQIVNAGGRGENVRQPLPMPDGVSNLAVEQQAMSAGIGAGAGAMKARRMKASAPMAESTLHGLGGGGVAAPTSAAPPPAEPKGKAHADGRAASPTKREIADDMAADKERREVKSSNPGPVVEVVKASSVGDTTPVVVALKRLLASRGTCPAGGRVQLRLTIDAKGQIVRIEVIGRDRSGEACWQKLFAGVSSGTAARGAETGSVEVTIGR
jgi:hypothetical protein